MYILEFDVLMPCPVMTVSVDCTSAT